MHGRITKGTLQLFSGMGFRKIVAFLYIMVVARIIPREQYGVYVLYEVIVLSMTYLGDFGLMLSATRIIATEEKIEEKLTAIGSVVLLRLITVGLFCILFLPARSIFSHMYKSPLFDTLMNFLPATLLMVWLNDVFSYILLGMQKHKQMAIGQAVAGITSIVGIIVLVWIGHLGVIGLTWNYILSCAASLIYQYVAVGVRFPICYNPSMMKKLLRFGFPLHLNNVVALIFMRLDTYIIGIYSGPSAVACYGIAMKLPDNVRQMSESLRLVYYSTTSQLFALKDEVEVQNNLENTIRWAAFVLFGGTMGTVLFGNDIIRLIYSEKYMDSAPIFSLLMIAMSFSICNMLLGTTLLAAGKPRRVFEIGFVTVIINVAANLVWIPRFGLMGAAYASLLTHGVIVTAYLWSLKKIGLSFRSSFLLKPVMVFALSYAAYKLCPWRNWVIIKLFFGGLYLAVSMLLGIVKSTDVTLLKESLSQKTGRLQ